MRRLALAIAMTVCACSSDPEASPTPAPTQEAGVDARVACGLPGEAVECLCATGPGLGRCNADGRIDPCVCLAVDAGPPAVDAVADAADVATDSSSDTADTYSPPATVQETLCRSGSPRLTWTAGVCTDVGTVSLTDSYACRFRVARDGKVRCLPASSTTVGGYIDGACAIELTTWTTDPVPPYLMLGDVPVSTMQVGKLGSGSWYQSTPSCAVQTTIYPSFTPSGQSVRVKERLVDGLFFAASI